MSILIEHELSRATPAKNTIVSVGVFDGIHMGHQTLVRRLTEQAHERDSLSTIITFKQHPSILLAPSKTTPALISLEERLRLLKSMSVDIVIPLTFSPELAALGAQSFVSILQQHLNMQGMILGWDFALGHHREGSLETLRELGQRLGFSTEVVQPVRYHDKIVSSTAIRQALSAGDISTVNAMLARPFSLEGVVVGGDKRGTTLGYPTANLSLYPQQALPADGVYAAVAVIDRQVYQAVAFIGTRPTFDEVSRIAEIHLLDFSDNLYNHNLKVNIVEWLREAKKFPGAQALQAQIALDIAYVRQKLSAHCCCDNHEKS
ncbi:MAG: bifunctional riboflavin kinase/FAD synthetase [Dehalococcoidia bacterium]|nr:bifunctional riboflavin kinase/FAD synthetase [Dehalococcoidia bacterium]